MGMLPVTNSKDEILPAAICSVRASTPGHTFPAPRAERTSSFKMEYGASGNRRVKRLFEAVVLPAGEPALHCKVLLSGGCAVPLTPNVCGWVCAVDLATNT